MKFRHIAVVFLLLVLPLALIADHPRRAEAADDPDWYDAHVETTLADLVANPTSFKTIKVRFKAIFHKIESIYSPFYTPFVPEEFIAFSIWDVDKKLWLKTDRMKDFPFCFMRKDSIYLHQVGSAKKYTLVEIIGSVENDFNNMPWIEVRQALPVTDRRLTDKALHHIVMGYEYLNSGQPALAEHEYWESLKYDLPDNAHLNVVQELAKIAFEARRWKEAEDLAQQILNMDEENQLGRDIYRAAREEMVRAYNTGAPHGIEGPSGTDNAHPVNQPDNRDRRRSATPKPENAQGPSIAQAGKPVEKPAATPADASARMSSQAALEFAELERKLGDRDKQLADRSAKLAVAEAEAGRLRQEKARSLEDQARVTSEVDSVREQLASVQVEKDKLKDEAGALAQHQVESNDTLAREVAELEARKAEAEKALTGRDAILADVDAQARALAACKAELAGLMGQRDEITAAIAARKAEVDGLLGKRDGLAQEIGARKADLEKQLSGVASREQELEGKLAIGATREQELEGKLAIGATREQELEGKLATGATREQELEGKLAAGLTRAQGVEAQVRELEARKAELDTLTERAENAGDENSQVTLALEVRKAELDGMLARRAQLSQELEERARSLEDAQAEISGLAGKRDGLRAQVVQAEQALAALTARRAEPESQAEPSTPDPDLTAKLKAVTERQELLVGEASRMRKEIAAKDLLIASLERDVETRTARIAELERTLRARDQKVAGLQGELGLARSQQQRQAAVLKEIADQVTALETRLNQDAASEGTASEPLPEWRGRRTPEGRRSPQEFGRN